MDVPRSRPVVVLIEVEYELGPAPPVKVELELTLEGVVGGRLVSTSVSVVRSTLFPTSIRLRFGDASARASLRKG